MSPESSAGRTGALAAIRRHGAVLLGYLLAAGALLRGVGGPPFARVVGLADFHVWEQLWFLWWWRTSLARGASPLTTNLLNFPRGLSTYHQMPTLLMPLLSLPFQWLAGLAGGYNLLALASLAAAAFGAYLVCRKISGRPLESLLGGVVFGFSPFLQTELAGGMVEQVLGMAILPWLLLVLLGLNESRSRRAACAAALLFAAVTLASWYCGVVAAFLTGLLFLLGLGSAQADARRCILAAYGVMGAVIVLLLAGPVALLVAGSDLQRDFNWQKACQIPGIRDKACPDALGLVAAAAPPANPPPETGIPPLVPFTIYLGKITALFALFALLVRSPAWRPWKAGFILFILLTLGPYLNLAGRLVWGGLRLPLPNRLLIAVAPGLSRMLSLHNYRFVAPALLFAGVLVTLGVGRALDGLTRAKTARAAVIAALGWLMLADFGQAVPGTRALALTTVAALVPPAYDVIRAAPPGAVLSIPLAVAYRSSPRLSGLEMYAQTLHRHPLLVGTTSFERTGMDDLSLVNAAQQMALGEEWRLDATALAGEWRRLRERGFAFVTLRPDLLRPRDRDPVRRLLEEQLGPPLAEGDGVSVFGIPAPPAQGAS